MLMNFKSPSAFARSSATFYLCRDRMGIWNLHGSQFSRDPTYHDHAIDVGKNTSTPQPNEAANYGR